MADLIDRQKIKAKFEPWLKVKGYSDGELNMLKAVLYEIAIMPSARSEITVDGYADGFADGYKQAQMDAIDALHGYFDGMLETDTWSPCDVYGLIEILPSADVQTVRHGHWIHDGFDIPHGVDWMHCSECGKRDIYCPAAMTNYCPNCGADMRGEQNG